MKAHFSRLIDSWDVEFFDVQKTTADDPTSTLFTLSKEICCTFQHALQAKIRRMT